MLNYDGTVAYDLNPNNYKQKKDGTASDATNDAFGGNVMIGLPTVWVKVDTSVARKPKFYFSNLQLDGGFKAYAHHDDYGNIMPYTYLPAYNGWVDGSSRLRSISGKFPTATQPGATQITEARANNPTGFTGWDIEKLVDRQLINLLLIMIGKTTDTQTAFGRGNESGYSSPASGAGANGVLNTGTLDDKGLFYGYSASNLAVKVFGMENYWGNIWRRTMGLVLSSGTIYYKLTKDTSDGSYINQFDPSAIGDSAGVPAGWISAGVISGGTDGGMVDVYVGDFGLLGKTTGGDYDSKYYDRLVLNNSGNYVALFGGGSNYGARCGAFACYLYNVLSYSYWNFGASPSCKHFTEKEFPGGYPGNLNHSSGLLMNFSNTPAFTAHANENAHNIIVSLMIVNHAISSNEVIT